MTPIHRNIALEGIYPDKEISVPMLQEHFLNNKPTKRSYIIFLRFEPNRDGSLNILWLPLKSPDIFSDRIKFPKQ